ncbi:MAG: phosphatidylglycerophosphatase A [Bdellovibrio sp.]|nr:phosphatidylglycerophosphatase A [Bdellovibrio sp.]
MNQKNFPSLFRADVIILSYFGIGFFPYAPGTCASIATLPILYMLTVWKIPGVFIIPIIILSILVCSFLAHRAQRDYQVSDPGWIVIDEVLGMLCAWLFCQSGNVLHLIMILVLFRFFDIVKVWPINIIDKRIKNGAGVIFDDIVAGIFSGLTYRFLIFAATLLYS